MNNVKMLVMDVDGTLTDGKIYYSSDSVELKAFNVKDGYAIKILLPQYGIIPAIITGRKSSIVERRVAELGIAEVHQGVSDKTVILKMLLEKYNLSNEEIAFIGDDLNDYDAIRFCGVTGCPKDAVDELKPEVSYVCKRAGGEGAAREFIEWIISTKAKRGEDK